MKFQIEAVQLGHKCIKLSSRNDNSENVFTILVGRNAAGKTRMLSKIVSNYIFSKKLDDTTSGEVITLSDSLSVPSRIIAISTGSFDRFPQPRLINRNQEALNFEYHYLGLSRFNSSPNQILSQSCTSLFEGLLDEKSSGNKLITVFDYLGFLPLLNVEFEISQLGRRLLNQSSYQELHDTYYGLMDSPYMYGGVRHSFKQYLDFDKEILPCLTYLHQKDGFRRKFSLRINLVQQNWNDQDTQDFIFNVVPLIKAGIIKVGGLNLFEKYGKDQIRFNHASSGQQCMLLMFLGIAGVISDNSLICIDEPEISLHPQWQSEFISIVQGVFSGYRGCHFLIATHSPQIVSGLTSHNGYIADLESNTLLFSADQAKKSADFQLAEIFHAPGFKNEYLIRILLVILSKLSKNEPLSNEDMAKLSQLEKIKAKISDSDPVYHLLNQVKMLAK